MKLQRVRKSNLFKLANFKASAGYGRRSPVFTGIGSREANAIKLAGNRRKLQLGLKNAIASRQVDLKGIGKDGPALSGLNLKAIKSPGKRKMYGKLIKALSRRS